MKQINNVVELLKEILDQLKMLNGQTKALKNEPAGYDQGYNNNPPARPFKK